MSKHLSLQRRCNVYHHVRRSLLIIILYKFENKNQKQAKRSGIMKENLFNVVSVCIPYFMKKMNWCRSITTVSNGIFDLESRMYHFVVHVPIICNCRSCVSGNKTYAQVLFLNSHREERRNEILYQITLSFRPRKIEPASKKIEIYNNIIFTVSFLCCSVFDNYARKRFYFLINIKWINAKKKKREYNSRQTKLGRSLRVYIGIITGVTNAKRKKEEKKFIKIELL